MRYSSRRPPLTTEPPPRPRHRRGKGRRYVPDVVERVRVLIVGTTWSEAEIARRVGVGVATVHGWKVRRGWQRPVGASVSTRKVMTTRAGFTRRCREALALIEALGRREADRLAEVADPALLERVRALAEIARRAGRPARRRATEAEGAS